MVGQRIGERLVSEGLVSSEQVNDAILQQQRSGGRLGEILTALGKLPPFILYHSLAMHWRRPFANLLIEPPDITLLRDEHLSDYMRLQLIPWQSEYGTLVIACTDVTEEVKQWARHNYDQPVEFAIATPRDILHALSHYYGDDIDELARTRLLLATPHLSASRTITRVQATAILVLLTLIPALLILYPAIAIPLFVALLNLFYIGTIGLKYLLYTAAQHGATDIFHDVAEHDLPVYSVLVPLYQEAASIPRLLTALRALDYPRHRLDIKLIVESDDRPTLEAIQAARPESFFEIIRVPYSLPRTKPKACDYALTFARGEFVTIYDAEDRPEPSQLRKAVVAFRSLPQDVICLQARLNYYNWSECMLSRLFAIEYGSLFDIMLPGLQRLRIPIPLGGTSNHFRLAALREIGEWDPYNVTEDADLGIRLAVYGYQSRMLDSITLEESPIRLKSWMYQRSRWIKGYMQTWLVHMRRPLAFYQKIGAAGFWGFQFFVGSPGVIFLLSPVLWLFSLSWWFGLLPSPWLPGWLAALCHLTLISGIFIHLWLARSVVARWQWSDMGPAIMLYPFYWFLHSLASYRALWQLIHRPHYWDKTTHGLSRLQAA